MLSAHARKLNKYFPVNDELREAGITYMPMVWTSNGRPHPAATRVMRHVAGLASHSREVGSNAKSMLKRWGHKIQVAIQRRKAAMVRAALPKLSATDEWLLTGSGPAEAATTGRAAPAEEDSNAPAFEIDPLDDDSAVEELEEHSADENDES